MQGVSLSALEIGLLGFRSYSDSKPQVMHYHSTILTVKYNVSLAGSEFVFWKLEFLLLHTTTVTSSGMVLPRSILCRIDMHCVLVSKDPVLASTTIGSTAPETIIAFFMVGETLRANVRREHIIAMLVIRIRHKKL